MLLTTALALVTFAAQPAQPRPNLPIPHIHAAHIPVPRLTDIATILAHDEGWPLGNPDYTLDPMIPVDDDGFDSIGVYRKAHLVRMYSINRSTGQIVDFMRGCQVFHFTDLQNFEQSIRSQSHAPALTDAQLADRAGCPKFTVVNSRWIH